MIMLKLSRHLNLSLDILVLSFRFKRHCQSLDFHKHLHLGVPVIG